MKKPLKLHQNKKFIPKKKKKKKKPKIYVFGRISRIPYDPTRSYHFYDPSAILIILVRWDCKIMRFYDLDRDFDNYAFTTLGLSSFLFFWNDSEPAWRLIWTQYLLLCNEARAAQVASSLCHLNKPIKITMKPKKHSRDFAIYINKINIIRHQYLG